VSPKFFVNNIIAFYVLPVPVGPDINIFLLFVINNLDKYKFLAESLVGTIISLYIKLLST